MTTLDWRNHQVKFANIACTTNGNNSLVAAVAGKAIRVLSLILVSSGTAVNVHLRTGDTPIALGDGTEFTPLDLTGVAGSPALVLPFNPAGWCTTTVGAALNLFLSAGNKVAGCLTYIEV